MKLRSTTNWRQGIKGEVIASCPSLKDGRTSEDRPLEAKTGGQGVVLIGKEQRGSWVAMDLRERERETSFPTLLTAVATQQAVLNY